MKYILRTLFIVLYYPVYLFQIYALISFFVWAWYMSIDELKEFHQTRIKLMCTTDITVRERGVWSAGYITITTGYETVKDFILCNKSFYDPDRKGICPMNEYMFHRKYRVIKDTIYD